MRLFRAVIPVTDLDEAVALYSHILGSPGVRVSPGRHYFDCEGVILCVYDAVADGDLDPVGPNPTPLYFETDSIEETHLRAIEAAQFRQINQIETRPWGERSFYATDPSGNVLCFEDKSTRFSGQFYVP